MSSVFGIRHTPSGSTSHGSDTRRRLSERPEDEVRGKADSSTNELKNNRYTKGMGGRRQAALYSSLRWCCCLLSCGPRPVLFRCVCALSLPCPLDV